MEISGARHADLLTPIQDDSSLFESTEKDPPPFISFLGLSVLLFVYSDVFLTVSIEIDDNRCELLRREGL